MSLVILIEMSYSDNTDTSVSNDSVCVSTYYSLVEVIFVFLFFLCNIIGSGVVEVS